MFEIDSASPVRHDKAAHAGEELSTVAMELVETCEGEGGREGIEPAAVVAPDGDDLGGSG